jgi:hypothetical protein
MKEYSMRFVSLARLAPFALALTLPIVGCGGSVGNDAAPTSSTSEELAARTPIPYVLQYVGTYDNAQAAHGELASLQLLRSGRYVAKFAGSTHAERGVFFGPSHPGASPLTLRLITTGHSFTGTIGAADLTYGAIRVTRSGVSTDLLARVPAPSESSCDDSGGAWRDDDWNPTTNLFCDCPAGAVYIPSEGGCVH